MKKSLLTLLILLSLALVAQSQTTHTVLGVPMGSSRLKTVGIMKSKGYIQKSPNSKNASFSNVKFGAFSKCDAIFYFINDKMYQCLIILPDGLEATIIDRYEDLNTEISKKYGEGESFKSFKSPYEDGDGYEITAIRIGKAEYNTFWNSGNLAINSYINPSLLLCIKYQDSVLVREAIKERDQKNSAEY